MNRSSEPRSSHQRAPHCSTSSASGARPRSTRRRVAELVQQLGDKIGETRDRAAGELISLGPVAIPALRQAVKDPDEPLVADRDTRCLQYLEGTQTSAIPIAAARLVAQRRPAGAAEVLLAYLPYADDEIVLEEIKLALTAVAVRDGKPDPVLVQALQDQRSICRAAAAEALSRVPGDELRPILRKMLQDPKPAVRLRVALALARTGKDPKAVSTLVVSLADVPLDQARLAEEYLLELAGDQAPKATLGADEASREKARDAWAAWWLGTEGPALLEEFTRRTLTDDLREKALVLIRQCGDESFDVREKASNDLAAMGSAIAGLLRQFANDGDLEITQRIRKVLQGIEKDKSLPLSPVFPRLVALRKPAGSAEAVINFLPFAESDSMVAECRDALAAVAVVGGKADPVLVKSLADKHPLKRAVAAEALWLAELPDQREAVRALLRDSDPTVRLRVALTLAGDREKEAIPVLIGLLADLPFDRAIQAEEFLRRVAAERSPEIVLLAEENNAKKCRDVWAAWWKDNAATVDLAAATAQQRLLGYTMVLYVNPGRLVEVGMDGKVRWQVDGFQIAYDAEVLPGDRVLIAEYNNMRVTERTIKGEVLWTKQLHLYPISAQRLRNGNTFIATNTQLIEVDKTGKEVLTLNRPNGDVLAAQKTRDGKIVLVNSQGQVVRLDATGKELKTFMAGPITLGGLEVLPNGRVLIAHYSNNMVVEYDSEGARVWEARVTQPASATRLPNGNTLVASAGAPEQAVELDRSGHVVWEYKTTNQRPWKVRRR